MLIPVPKLAHMMTGRRTHEFTIGDRLRKAREVAGYDQRGFETASGISRATISAYELGKSTPKRAYLSIWANVTDTDVDWLMYGDDPEMVRSPEDTENGNFPEAGQGDDPANVRDPEDAKNVPRKGPRSGWGPLA